jgi:RNA polymerase sigma-70 factor (ECF subfamily)
MSERSRGVVQEQVGLKLSGVDAHVDARGDDVVAAISGDAEALQRVWNDNRRWVAAVILAHKPRWADLDDLLQEVAVSLVRKVGEVRDPSALKPWLRTVAMNASLASARSGRKRARDTGIEDDNTYRGRSVRPEVDSEDREEGRRLMVLAEKLPDGYREPLLLKALHDLSYREIGAILELPETTIETRIARGRRMLRELASQHV